MTRSLRTRHTGGQSASLLDKGVKADLAIDAQLAKVGVQPSDIKYVVLGHMHLDHAGNIGKFPKATIVAQRDEIENAFYPKPGTACCYVPGDFAQSARLGRQHGQYPAHNRARR